MDLDFRGLIPATVLPMTSDAEIDEAALRRYMKWVVGQGVVGVAINVDTGETAHLDQREKVRVLEIVKEELPPGCMLVAGVGGPWTAQAVRQAQEYKAVGADALLVFPIPAYMSAPLAPEVPLRYHQAIARVGLPLILFQLQPALGGVVYEQETLRQLASMDEAVAIKLACFNARIYTDTVETIRSLDRGLSILTGNDNFIFESLLLGADGALLGFGAIMTAEQVELLRLTAARDLDKAIPLGKRVQGLADTVFAAPVANYRVRLKEALVMLGVLDNATVREPLLPISDSERQTIRKGLREAQLL